MRFLTVLVLLLMVHTAGAAPPAGCSHSQSACCARCQASCRHVPRCAVCPAPAAQLPCPPQHIHVDLSHSTPAPCEEPGAGVFAAPLGSGTVEGESMSVGIRGLEIEFPAFRLRLPSIKLPSLFRARTDSRMLLDNTTAPFIATTAGSPAPAAYPAATVPHQVVAASPPSQAYLSVPQTQYPGPSQQQVLAIPMQPAGKSAITQQSCPSSENEAMEARAEAAASRLRALEEAERRLEEKLRQLHILLQQTPTPSCPPATVPCPVPPAAPSHPPSPVPVEFLPIEQLPLPAPRKLEESSVSPAHFETSAAAVEPMRPHRLPVPLVHQIPHRSDN